MFVNAIDPLVNLRIVDAERWAGEAHANEVLHLRKETVERREVFSEDLAALFQAVGAYAFHLHYCLQKLKAT